MITFNAEERFNIKGRGIVYCGIYDGDINFLNKEITIIYKDEEIKGTCVQIERFVNSRHRGTGVVIRETTV